MRVQLLTRSWVTQLLKKRLAKPVNREVIPLAQVLSNAIKMQAISMGSKVRFS